MSQFEMRKYLIHYKKVYDFNTLIFSVYKAPKKKLRLSQDALESKTNRNVFKFFLT
jgi:hypothetical protein